MVRAIGGDLVGMSTVLEAIAAREAGMEVLGISLVTNLAAGITGEPLNHEEVLEAGQGRGHPDGRAARRDRPEDLTCASSSPAPPAASARSSAPASSTAGHTVVGLDLTPEPEGFTGAWFTADCADPDAVDAVFDAGVGPASTPSSTWPASRPRRRCPTS